MNFMSEVEQISATQNLESPASDLSARMFLTDEFHYKCKPDKDGNTAEVLLFESPYPVEAMRQLPAPQNPYYDVINGRGEPQAQVQKNTATDSVIDTNVITKKAESPDPCR